MRPTPEPLYPCGLVWFRRDLRASDHAALYRALTECAQVHCVFVFDQAILAPLPRNDRRVGFIHACLLELHSRLRALTPHGQGGLIVRHAVASEAIAPLAAQLSAAAVYANHDDEPASQERDALVRTRLAAQGCAFHTYKDHVVFERGEVLTQSGTPYSVFTPYKNSWLKKIDAFQLQSYDVARHAHRLAPLPPALAQPVPSLEAIGFDQAAPLPDTLAAGESAAQAQWQSFAERMDRYAQARDFPALKGPSYLSVHLRFGTLSVRTLARQAHARMLEGCPGAAVWLQELIWRDFYAQVLHHHPHVVGHSFKPAYDAIAWESGAHAQALFSAWCEGRTGYPLVDAAMAQINQTGYMHNRLRMVVASFLVKDLGIDWRWGEAYFAAQLNDFDLASNNGGWQWASSSGCDAQPYFRIFNPVRQSQKFDPEGRFIGRYLPALLALPPAARHAPWQAKAEVLQAAGVRLGVDYPEPIVDHDAARARTLERYSVVADPAAGDGSHRAPH